jgi:hypothetical protein
MGRQEKAEQAGEAPFGEEEVVGREAFISRWVGVTLVKGQKLVEQGCPCPPMSDNEERRMSDLGLSPSSPPYELLQVAEGGIHQGGDADEHQRM